MNFKEFRNWLLDNLRDESHFETLGGRSHFHAHYDPQNGLMFRLSSESEGQLTDEQIQSIFERYQNGTPQERSMTSFYTDPWWVDRPNRILAPYVPAIMRVWIQDRKNT